MDQLKMYSLLKMGIFHGHVSLLEGNSTYKGEITPGKPIYFQLFFSAL